MTLVAEFIKCWFLNTLSLLLDCHIWIVNFPPKVSRTSLPFICAKDCRYENTQATISVCACTHTVGEVESQSPCVPLGGPHVRTHMRTHLRMRHMCGHRCGVTTHEPSHVPTGVEHSSCESSCVEFLLIWGHTCGFCHTFGHTCGHSCGLTTCVATHVDCSTSVSSFVDLLTPIGTCCSNDLAAAHYRLAHAVPMT